MVRRDNKLFLVLNSVGVSVASNQMRHKPVCLGNERSSAIVRLKATPEMLLGPCSAAEGVLRVLRAGVRGPGV